MKEFNTLNSVVIAITRHHWKVLDGQIISKFCHVYAKQESLTSAAEYDEK